MLYEYAKNGSQKPTVLPPLVIYTSDNVGAEPETGWSVSLKTLPACFLSSLFPSALPSFQNLGCLMLYLIKILIRQQRANQHLPEAWGL